MPSNISAHTTSSKTDTHLLDINSLIKLIILPSIQIKDGNIDENKLFQIFWRYCNTDAKLMYSNRGNCYNYLFSIYEKCQNPLIFLDHFKNYIAERFSSLNLHDLIFLHAVINSNTETVQEYLKDGFNPIHIKDASQQGILFLASWNQDYAMLRLLLNINREPNIFTQPVPNQDKYMLLHLCTGAPKLSYYMENLGILPSDEALSAIIKLIVDINTSDNNNDSKLNINCIDAHEKTSMHYAVKSGFLTVFTLWQAGADLTALDTYGNTPAKVLAELISVLDGDLLYSQYVYDVATIQEKKRNCEITKMILQFLLSVTANTERQKSLGEVTNQHQQNLLQFCLTAYPHLFSELCFKLSQSEIKYDLNAIHVSQTSLRPISLIELTVIQGQFNNLLFFLFNNVNYDIDILLECAKQAQQTAILSFLKAIKPEPESFAPSAHLLQTSSQIRSVLIEQLERCDGYGIFFCLKAYNDACNSEEIAVSYEGLLHHLAIAGDKENDNKNSDKTIAILTLLLAVGFDINERDTKYNTILDHAEKLKDHKLIDFLGNNGAVSAKDQRKKLAHDYVIDALTTLQNDFTSASKTQTSSTSSINSSNNTITVNPLFTAIPAIEILDEILSKLKETPELTLKDKLKKFDKKTALLHNKIEGINLLKSKLDAIAQDEQQFIDGTKLPSDVKPSDTVKQTYQSSHKDYNNPISSKNLLRKFLN